jgi:glucose/arabinose dehydrogenase
MMIDRRILGLVAICITVSCLALCTGQENGTAQSTPAAAIPADRVGLDLIAEGFTAPLALVQSPDETGRLFVIEQTGQIRVIDAIGTLLGEPFLDISDRMVDISGNYDERGLLGLAFDPEFADTQRFFVYYSAPLRAGAPSSWDHTSHVSEFTVSEIDPNRANVSSERVLLYVDEPQSNHNAGQITFGPDGYLYIPLGDGGGAGDVGIGHPLPGNGQNTSTLLGSILRIDVDGGEPYGIPADNPFANGSGGREEIFAYGFRNPFRIAFDAGGNNSLIAGDAGQNRWEEVDVVTAGGNYGWNIREGTHCFNPQDPNVEPADCTAVGSGGEPLINPVIEYQNAHVQGGIGLVVIGGYVYRGNTLPGFTGEYIFGDWSRSWATGDGTLFAATPQEKTAAESPGMLWTMQELTVVVNDSTPPSLDVARARSIDETGRIGGYVLSFGQDETRELYVLTSDSAGPTGKSGKIFKLVPP